MICIFASHRHFGEAVTTLAIGRSLAIAIAEIPARPRTVVRPAQNREVPARAKYIINIRLASGAGHFIF